MSLLAEPRAHPLWRLSVPPASGAVVAEAITRRLEAALFYDWGGGLVWLAATPEHADAGAAVIRAAVGEAGHATLIRAPEAVRGAVAVFAPESPALAALSSRVKASFDPRRVLNPGRMYAGV